MHPAASHRGNDRVRWSPMTAESSDRVPESRPAEPKLSRGHGRIPGHVIQKRRYAMSGLNNLMGRGVIAPVGHGVLDYPLAAVLILLPLVLGFDDAAATWIAVAF